MLNFVSFSAKENDGSSEPESSSYEDEELDPKVYYIVLYDSWVLLSNDKLRLTQEKLKLEAKVNVLEEENKAEKVDDKLSPSEKEWFENTKKNLEKSTMLERELNENHKKIRMLNNGGKNLDEILSAGIMGSQHHGLGYKHGSSSGVQITVSSINFVKSKSDHKAETSELEQSNGREKHKTNIPVQ